MIYTEEELKELFIASSKKYSEKDAVVIGFKIAYMRLIKIQDGDGVLMTPAFVVEMQGKANGNIVVDLAFALEEKGYYSIVRGLDVNFLKAIELNQKVKMIFADAKDSEKIITIVNEEFVSQNTDNRKHLKLIVNNQER